MFNKILQFLGIGTTETEMDLVNDYILLNIKIDKLIKRIEEHEKSPNCDGTNCDPWPELTKAEKEAGCEWDFSSLPKLHENNVNLDWDVVNPEFEKWLEDESENIIFEECQNELCCRQPKKEKYFSTNEDLDEQQMCQSDIDDAFRYLNGEEYNARLNVEGGLVINEGEMIMEIKKKKAAKKGE